ncbi:hypothetical protein Taro_010889 [Colocasia esculenta]|uniref:CBS domain-containing protein n=1 Tax=Colocasia esculenta TaxID=4460 RepID=A0A843UB00_COLES|nr:hypothetical protein [Colocasia esculenta]
MLPEERPRSEHRGVVSRIQHYGCMEAFSKGVHRALVPLESNVSHVVAAELVESSPGYGMLTQMDILSFLRSHDNVLNDIISCSVEEMGAVNENVFSITTCSKVIDVLKSMSAASLRSVPIVEANGDAKDEDVLVHRKGRRLVGTFSATDLRGCPIGLLQSWLSLTITEFKEKGLMHCNTGIARKPRTLVSCYPETSLGQVMEEAMACHVHRVWVVDGQGLLVGLVSLSDMLRAIQESLLLAERES